MATLQELTVVTITYNNPEDLIKTFESLNDFREHGGTHIIVNGGHSVQSLVNDVKLIEEPDKGIYDALNKGIAHVTTPFFMLIHSGDFLVETTEVLKSLLIMMEKEELDFLLNDCSIEFGRKKRLMKSSNWKPWMFKLGAQPPHPPTIYRTELASSFQYDLEHPIIADYKYLEDIINSNLKWSKGHRLLIHMSQGGATSSGLKSFFHVNRQFRKLKGDAVTILFTLSRPLIKIYLSK